MTGFENLATIFVAGDSLGQLAGPEALKIARAIEQVLGDLEPDEQAGRLPAMRVLTGTAPGVDALAVQAAIKLGVPLHVLGFESDATGTKLAQGAAQRVVLLPDVAGLPPAAKCEMVQARDEIALSYSDILIAVWDANTASERAGRLIREAAIRGMPAIVVGLDGSARHLPSHSLERGVPRHLSYIDPDAAGLERLLAQYDPRQVQSEAAALAKSALVCAEMAAHLQKADKAPRSWKPGIFHDLLSALSTLDWRAAKKAWARDRSKDYYGVSASELPEPMRLQHPIAEPEPLYNAFSCHDVAANRYAGLHRDMTWMVYGMSALAVFAAVAGEIGLGGSHSTVFWGVTELFLLAGILGAYSLAKKGDWHRRWLLSRYSAEVIRYARVSFPVLAPPDILRQRFAASLGNKHESEPDAEAVALRRLLIGVGLPCAQKQGISYRAGEHLHACIEYARHVIADQIAYHDKKSKESHRIGHALHRITHTCFLVTGVAIIGHLFFHLSGLLLLTAALPAFAAAVHGISTQNEFERLAAISHATSGELSMLLVALEHSREDEKDAAHRWLLANKVTADAARAMSGSAQQWQEIVLQRSASLPS